MKHTILCGDSAVLLPQLTERVDLTFMDPPFNQQKEYALHNDAMPSEEYWALMRDVCKKIYAVTNEGGCLYFMQREKNTEFVLQTLRETGWVFQNLLVWKKQTSAVPVRGKYGKQYQIIAYAVKGERARVFNRLRINPKLPANYKTARENGIFVTDVWDDIRELTSGYFAGPEALRDESGARFHKQQAPLALLLRIILTSTLPGSLVLDPFSGTGTTAVVAMQTGRSSISIELDPRNVACIEQRLAVLRDADSVVRYYEDYTCTKNLKGIFYGTN